MEAISGLTRCTNVVQKVNSSVLAFYRDGEVQPTGILFEMHVSLTTLLHRKWIINSRGYANIIPSKEDIVYGFIFELTQADERRLDKFEGKEYERLNKQVKLVTVKDSYKKGTVTALVYIDIVRKDDDVPKDEYVDRINMAVKDGLKEGIPKEYFDKYIRPFIPER